jgi:hypothetical protein
MLSWKQKKLRDERRKARRKNRGYVPLYEKLQRAEERRQKLIQQAREKLRLRQVIRNSVLGR